ncbi:alpha/beta hydrolase [Aspergillus thermomutatus]|uniref:Serine hydrolase domain-containing protein n=1 Tax=Aspergillus thermomutatus TaxID=41047 RepID=A0A397HUM6_ASPTH|nr:uncharacterized protein CDV56_106448 [Aspergillus thermomutatus]RHZ66732.1 hypothetical protein CDV56_106448 [Aspergillus thermomutatus]
MKVLMVHGSKQSGELFRTKCQPLERLLRKAYPGIELLYPTAPFRLEKSPEKVVTSAATKLRAEYGEWTWWNQPDSFDGLYTDLELGLDVLASVLEAEGPVDGMIGFSQGGAAAVMMASLLEGRQEALDQAQTEGGMDLETVREKIRGHPPLKFVVSVAGYRAEHPAYRAFYEPAIKTPSLHVLGSLDSVVEEETAMKLVQSCSGVTEQMIIWHSGGHVIPSGKRELVSIVRFIGSHVP